MAMPGLSLSAPSSATTGPQVYEGKQAQDSTWGGSAGTRGGQWNIAFPGSNLAPKQDINGPAMVGGTWLWVGVLIAGLAAVWWLRKRG